MNDRQKKALLAGGAIAAIGIAYAITSGSSEQVGGSGGGGSMYIPGAAIEASPPAEPGGDVSYTIDIPEVGAPPAMPMYIPPPQPAVDDLVYVWDEGYTGKKKPSQSSGVSYGVPVSTPGGKTVYAYGVSMSDAKAAQSQAMQDAKSTGSDTWTAGKSIAPGVTTAAPTPSTGGGTKKDSAVSEAAKAGISAGFSASPAGRVVDTVSSAIGGIGSAIGGLFGW